MEGDRQSWLDQKIAADRIIRDGLEPFWDDLWAAVRSACNKLREAYPHKRDCDTHLNENNSRIRVVPTPATGIRSTLEIRLDRKAHRLFVTMVPGEEEGETDPSPSAKYFPAPDLEHKKLLFSDGTTPYPALELAEHEICIRLLGMKPDSSDHQ
jgi:hypothetical protein